MKSLDNFEIIGQISGKPLDDSVIQYTSDVSFGLQHELDLYILAQDLIADEQALARKTIEIMQDDMSFNLSALESSSQATSKAISNCLHESIENINEFLIEQQQLNSDEHPAQGVSLGALQIHDKGISCCMHGNASCYKLTNETLTLIGSKLSLAKKLGINPSLSFTIFEDNFDVDDIIFISTFKLVEQLGLDFIRITLSRFTDNLYMAIRQINARASKKGISDSISFLICKKTELTKAKNGWLGKFK